MENKMSVKVKNNSSAKKSTHQDQKETQKLNDLMKIKGREMWSFHFRIACKKNNVEKMKELVENKEYLEKGWVDIHAGEPQGFQSESAWIWACKMGSLGAVKYLTTDKNLLKVGQAWVDPRVHGNHGLMLACRHGHLEVVKYLLTSPQLKEAGQPWADVHAALGSSMEAPLMMAFEGGHLELVKYLITSKEIESEGRTRADLNQWNIAGLEWASRRDQWDMVKFLCKSKELKAAGWKTIRSKVVLESCLRMASMMQSDRVVRGFIFELGMKKPKNWVDSLYPKTTEYFRVSQEQKELKSVIKKQKGKEKGRGVEGDGHEDQKIKRL